jgi:hypothetical protein
MSQVAFQKPVEDSVPRINDEVAVGEDLEFQRAWWKFEKAVWVFFALLIVLDIAGLFGRGPLADATLTNPAMTIHYERIERTGTPSMLNINFAPSAIQDGKLRLFVSESVVSKLGAQRIIPSPETSAVGNGGITYTFPATMAPAAVTFALEPARPGIADFALQVPGAPVAQSRVYIVP